MSSSSVRHAAPSAFPARINFPGARQPGSCGTGVTRVNIFMRADDAGSALRTTPPVRRAPPGIGGADVCGRRENPVVIARFEQVAQLDLDGFGQRRPPVVRIVRPVGADSGFGASRVQQGLKGGDVDPAWGFGAPAKRAWSDLQVPVGVGRRRRRSCSRCRRFVLAGAVVESGLSSAIRCRGVGASRCSSKASSDSVRTDSSGGTKSPPRRRSNRPRRHIVAIGRTSISVPWTAVPMLGVPGRHSTNGDGFPTRHIVGIPFDQHEQWSSS